MGDYEQDSDWELSEEDFSDELEDEFSQDDLANISQDLSEEDFEEENILNRNEKRKSIELSESEVSQEDENEICFTKGMACKTQGTSQSKMHIQRTCEDPFVEADEKHALCFFKLKSGNELIQNGYLVEIEFDEEIPDDLNFSTFARVFVKATTSKNVRFSSKEGFEQINENEVFPFAFRIESYGETNVEEFLENNNFSIKLFWSRYRENCRSPISKRRSKSLKKKSKRKSQAAQTLFGSFNIQVFGKEKMKKEPVKEILVKILTRYDVFTIQEIRDASGEAFPELIAALNEEKDRFDFHVGERQGTTISKEQFGFGWDREKLKLIDSFDFEDENNLFERPPGVVVLQRTGKDAKAYPTQRFIVVSCHIKPETGVKDMTTEEEINNLKLVFEMARDRHPEVKDCIIAGDMNADLHYVKDPEALQLYKDPKSKFLIDFDADTTAKDTDAAYDHIVLYGETIQANIGCAQVFDFEEAFKTKDILYEEQPLTFQISDHYPVEFSFS